MQMHFYHHIYKFKTFNYIYATWNYGVDILSFFLFPGNFSETLLAVPTRVC